MAIGIPIIKDNSNWSNVGGCAVLHPFNEEKRQECEAAYSGKAKNVSAQADLLLAQAALEKQRKLDQPKGWSAGQTTMVVVGSLLAITIMIVVIKRAKSKN